MADKGGLEKDLGDVFHTTLAQSQVGNHSGGKGRDTLRGRRAVRALASASCRARRWSWLRMSSCVSRPSLSRRSKLISRLYGGVIRSFRGSEKHF